MSDNVQSVQGLLLVGTVHLDPRGYGRLAELLGQRQPSAISLEVSPYAISFREREGERLRDRIERFRAPGKDLPGGLAALFAQLELPFEYQAANAHARKASIPLHLLGDSERSRELLSLLLAEAMTDENLETLARRSEQEPLALEVEREWRRARQGARPRRPLCTAEAKRLAAEDQAMAQKLRDLGIPGTLIHVCGWEHLSGLAADLADLDPEVALLDPAVI